MKEYTMLNYGMIFSEKFSRISNQAKLLYIKLNFYAIKGFVTNPMQILNSLNYDKKVFDELVDNGDILTLEGRGEIFITAYYVHNYSFPRSEWLRSPFAPYWKKKMTVNEDGLAVFGTYMPMSKNELLGNVSEPKTEEIKIENPKPIQIVSEKDDEEEWNNIVREIEEIEKVNKDGF